MDTVTIENLYQNIDFLKSQLGQTPDDPNIFLELNELLRQAGDWNGLNMMLKTQLSKCPDSDIPGKILIWEEMLELYQNQLKSESSIVLTCKKILALDPAHSNAAMLLKNFYQEKGRWSDLAMLLVSMAEIEADPEKEVALLHEATSIWLEKLRNSSRAITSLHRILQIDPGNNEAFDRYISLNENRHAWSQIVDIMEQRTAVLHGDDKVQLSIKTAQVIMTRIAKTEYLIRARALVGQVLQIHPNHENALVLHEQICDKLQDWDTNCNALEQLVAETPDEEQRIKYLFKLANICLNKLDKTNRAIDALEQVNSLRPGDAQAFGMLKDIYLSSRNWSAFERLCGRLSPGTQGLISCLQEAADESQNIADKKWLLFRCAEILENDDGDAEQVLSCYERILREDPEDSRSIQNIVMYHVNNQNWHSLVDELEKITDISAIIPLLPSDKASLTQLENASASSGNWHALAAVLRGFLSFSVLSEDEWRNAALRLAATIEKHFEVKEEAIGIYAEVLKRFPNDSEAEAALQLFLNDRHLSEAAARLLKPIWIRQEKWSLLPRLYSILIDTEKVDDQRLDLQIGLVELYEKQLCQADKALTELTGIIKENPGNIICIEKLLDMAESLEPSSKMARTVSEICSEDSLKGLSDASLFSRFARLFEKKYMQSAEAEVFHLKVLQMEPQNQFSFDSLVRYYTTSARWTSLADLYLSTSRGKFTVKRRTELILNACQIIETHLQDAPREMQAYESLLQLEPRNARAQAALENLYKTNKLWNELYQFYLLRLRHLPGNDKIEMLLKLGTIAVQYLNQPERALENYKELLEIAPDNKQAQEAVEQLFQRGSMKAKSAKVLERIYRHRGATDQIIEMLRIELENEMLGNDERGSILLRLAKLEEKELLDRKAAFGHYKEAFILKPDEKKARRGMARLSRRLNVRENYAKTLEQVMDRTDLDDDLFSDIVGELYELVDKVFRDAARMEKICRKVLERNLRNTDTVMMAIDALYRILSPRGNQHELIPVLSAKLTMEKNTSIRKIILCKLALINESIPTGTQEATRLYQEAIKYDIGDRQAFEGLKRLYEREDNLVELIDITEQMAISEQNPVNRHKLYRQLAELGGLVSSKKVRGSGNNFGIRRRN